MAPVIFQRFIDGLSVFRSKKQKNLILITVAILFTLYVFTRFSAAQVAILVGFLLSAFLSAGLLSGLANMVPGIHEYYEPSAKEIKAREILKQEKQSVQEEKKLIKEDKKQNEQFRNNKLWA